MTKYIILFLTVIFPIAFIIKGCDTSSYDNEDIEYSIPFDSDCVYIEDNIWKYFLTY